VESGERCCGGTGGEGCFGGGCGSFSRDAMERDEIRCDFEKEFCGEFQEVGSFQKSKDPESRVSCSR
jgi:hypothetical protein